METVVMGVRQIEGKLEKISIKDSLASVRVNGETLYVSIADRGVLEGDSIRNCSQEERIQPITLGSRIRLDIEGPKKNKRIVAWAPK